MTDEVSDTDLDSDLKNIKNYRGSFLSDNIPKSKGNTNYYVVNMDSGSGSGTHWMGLIELPDKIYYFDPFGFPPNKNVLKWIKSRRKPYFYNTTDVQAVNSSACGKIVAFLIKHISKGVDINKIINHLAGEGFSAVDKETRGDFKK